MHAPSNVDAVPHHKPALLVTGVAVLTALVVFGALQLEFLCDDAYITFRYVANAHDGNGLVWNPAPFEPVEGYTCFAWAVWLWAIWSWFGIEPPDAANVSSIVFGVLLFLATAMAALRIRGASTLLADGTRTEGKRLSTTAVLCTLLVIACNRTFLTWLTGGLETAMFNLAFVGWVILAFRDRERRTTNWILLWTSAAALAALTRPDGLLVVAATGAVLAWSVFRGQAKLRRTVLAAMPLLTVVMHIAWRRAFYGEWLPNTYYAKVTSPWPEAGVRFLACFLFEHGAWLWLPLAGIWVFAELRRGVATVWQSMLANLPAVAAVAVVLAHVSYYVIRVGGDPFEYRILSQLVPLGALAVAAMMARVISGSWLTIVATLLVAASSCFGWLHFALYEADLSPFHRPIFEKVPSFAQPLVRWHDRNQAWLRVQVLCGRRELHELFLRQQHAELPERSRLTPDPDDLPVARYTGVGLAGWALPDVAILDQLGLNDWVVARTPVAERTGSLLPKPVIALMLAKADTNQDGRYSGAELKVFLGALPGVDKATTDGLVTMMLLLFANESTDAFTKAEAEQIEPFFTSMRFMAHERMAPPEYVKQLEPNVTIRNGKIVIKPRSVPLTADRLRSIEADWRERTR